MVGDLHVSGNISDITFSTAHRLLIKESESFARKDSANCAEEIFRMLTSMPVGQDAENQRLLPGQTLESCSYHSRWKTGCG